MKERPELECLASNLSCYAARTDDATERYFVAELGQNSNIGLDQYVAMCLLCVGYERLQFEGTPD